jgi:hypothetical protein
MVNKARDIIRLISRSGLVGSRAYVRDEFSFGDFSIAIAVQTEEIVLEFGLRQGQVRDRRLDHNCSDDIIGEETSLSTLLSSVTQIHGVL